MRKFTYPLFALSVLSLVLLSFEDHGYAASVLKSLNFQFSNPSALSSSLNPLTVREVGLPGGTVYKLQRQNVKTHGWKTVLSFHVRGGIRSFDAPKVAMGRYPYRIVATSHERVIEKSAQEILYSYSSVPLLDLCEAPNLTGTPRVGGSGCKLGAIEVGSSLFSYAFIGNYDSDTPPNYATIFTFGMNTCRSLSLQFALGLGASFSGDTAYVQLLEVNGGAQVASVPYGSIGSLDVAINGASWSLTNAATHGDSVYWGGSALCWSSTGQ